MWPEADLARAPAHDFPPRWASVWGDDPYGLWADLMVNGVAQRMRWIEPGEFTMGSTAQERRSIKDKQRRDWADRQEAPPHRVRISAGFWLADTPCTQAMWLAVVGGDNPAQFHEGPEAPLRPVERVTWDQVMERFVGSLRTLRPEADPCLPTEAQWEYACRAGTRTAYAWGEEPDTQRANIDGSVGQTSVVKRYPVNPWGLFDMHGNVWEWCADAMREYQDRPEVDPSGGTEGDVFVLRGGSWGDHAGYARSAYRNHDHRGNGWYDDGFRLALRSPSPAGGAGDRQAR